MVADVMAVAAVLLAPALALASLEVDLLELISRWTHFVVTEKCKSLLVASLARLQTTSKCAIVHQKLSRGHQSRTMGTIHSCVARMSALRYPPARRTKQAGLARQAPPPRIRANCLLRGRLYGCPGPGPEPC